MAVAPGGVAWMQAETYTALDARLADTAVFGRPSLNLARPGGVFPGFGGNLKVTSSGLTISVASGACLVPELSGAGSYRVVNNGTVTVAVTAAPPGGRTDLIIMQVNETGSAATSEGKVAVVQGSSTTPPPMPTDVSAIKLAQVTVTNSVTSVADFRTWAVAVGGVLPGTSATRPANPYDGMTVWDNDTFNLAVYSGSGGAWRTVPTGSTGGWTEYNPLWKASSINPTPGGSTIKGRYLQNGKTVHFTISLNIVTGGSFGIGNGTYSFTLPVQAVTTTGPAQRQLVTAHYFDTSGTGTVSSKQWVGNGLIKSAASTVSEIRLACGDGSTSNKGGIWTHTQPRQLANGDDMTVSGTYECA